MPMMPHLMSLGFDWSFIDVEPVPRDTPVTFTPSKPLNTSPIPSVKAPKLDNFHTSLHLPRPVDHPLSRRYRQRQLSPLLNQSTSFERSPSSNTWASDVSACVSSLGVGGWDEMEGENDSVEEEDDNQALLSIQGLDLPENFPMIFVSGVQTDHREEMHWIKVMKGNNGVLWLEDEEIFVFLELLKSSSIKTVCVHLSEDDVSAIVPLSEAVDYFDTMIPHRASQTTIDDASVSYRCINAFLRGCPQPSPEHSPTSCSLEISDDTLSTPFCSCEKAT